MLGEMKCCARQRPRLVASGPQRSFLNWSATRCGRNFGPPIADATTRYSIWCGIAFGIRAAGVPAAAAAGRNH